MRKVITAAEAVSRIKDEMTLMIGGFMAVGTPLKMVDALVKSGVKNLTVICNDTAFPDKGIGRLVANGQVKRLITSHIGTNPVTIDKMNAGELIVEFSPQGTLVERIRAAGAGLGGVLTPTGLGTVVAEGKQTIVVDGKEYLLEKPLRADVALIGASYGDTEGNLVYRGTSQNFNPAMATAADLVLAEVADLRSPGDIPPEQVHTPSIFVDFVVAGSGS